MYLLTMIMLIIVMALIAVYFLNRKNGYEKFVSNEFLEHRKSYTKTQYICDFESAGVSKEIAESLVKNLRMVMDDEYNRFQIVFPKLDDHLESIWGIDEEKSEIIEGMLRDFGVNDNVKWNSKEVLSINTVFEMLTYFNMHLDLARK